MYSHGEAAIIRTRGQWRNRELGGGGGENTWGAPGTAGTVNVAFLESGGVMSMSSALRLPWALAVSERPGEDTGVWSGALSNAVATATTREKDGIR